MSDGRIRRLVILGGGTAGWMTASYLGKALQGEVDITLLEAPTIPRIGVGEATVPNLHSAFFDFLGIPEHEWMREVNASFKAGIKFVNWRTPGAGAPEPRPLGAETDYFYHHFAHLQQHDGVPLPQYWYLKQQRGDDPGPFDRACFPETAVLDAKKGPWKADGTRAMDYAWHFDAALVADFLRRFATQKQGVRHVQGEMAEVVQDERGFITALRTKDDELLEGDLFVDCSGFRGLLINKAMGEPFVDMGHKLLNDSAVATAVPHDDAANGVEPSPRRSPCPTAGPGRSRCCHGSGRATSSPASSPPARPRRRSSASCGGSTRRTPSSTTSPSGWAATAGPGCATASPSAWPPASWSPWSRRASTSSTRPSSSSPSTSRTSGSTRG